MNGASCMCLTYGRPRLLEEAIECFKKQNYPGPKELLILNDHPDQPLALAEPLPDVFIVNLPRRLRTLGEKRNLAVALSKYDNLLGWDDDDIYLPHRISEAMLYLPQRQYFKSNWAWHMEGNMLTKKPACNLFHGGVAFTRWLFEKVGGYSCMNAGEDSDFEAAIRAETGTDHWVETKLPLDRLYYIYRWNHGQYHTSFAKSLREIEVTADGPWMLRPHWLQDYTSVVAKNIAELRTTKYPTDEMQH